jgi:phytoene dehydrogenase-like protein
VTAAYLARAGRKVVVLERRELIGGCSVTEEVWPGFRVSTAAYLASLLQERIVHELDLERFGYKVDAKDPAFFSPFPDGRYFFMWQDQRKTLEEIAKFSRRDAEVYPQYEEELERLSQLVEWLLFTLPPQFPPHKPGDFLEYLRLAARTLKELKQSTSGRLVSDSRSKEEILAEDDRSGITSMFRRCVGRAPDDIELKRTLAALAQFRDRYHQKPDDAAKLVPRPIDSRGTCCYIL